jgi:hypothetical protein
MTFFDYSKNDKRLESVSNVGMNLKFVSSFLFVTLLALIVIISAGIRPSVAAPTGESNIYIPFQATSKPDFTVTDIEIFQATQTDNNTVPLVSGKTAVARIYVQLLAGISPAGVPVSLTAVRNGANIGTVNATGPTTIPASPQRGIYNSTFNVILPDSWLSGQVQFTATVDPGNTIPEGHENNNQFARIVTFNNVPDLQVVLVPIDYIHQGSTNPGFYPGQGFDNISNWVRRAFPVDNVNVTIRPDYPFSGNLQGSSAWLNLLNQIYVLKLSDGHLEETPIVYYGFVPIQNGSTQWFFSGIAGIGWISPPGQNFRDAVGLNLGANDETGILAGHEIGHNLGRDHAPCGGPDEPDPSYPYAGASIGQYGMDIQGSTVAFNTPTSHVDMMSYCSPEWVSDYTYNALYNNQRVQGLLQQATPVADHLVIRAILDDNNAVTLAPTYAFATQSSHEIAASDTVAELLDAQGNIITTTPLAIREAEEEGIYFRSVMGTVPLPSTPVASIRLVAEGTVLTERPFSEPDRLAQTALAITQTPQLVTLNWGLPNVPALVRYTADNGTSWTTLAIDTLGGSLSLDVADWMGESGRFQIILADTGSVSTLTAEWLAP